jgi:hypothetical protein
MSKSVAAFFADVLGGKEDDMRRYRLTGHEKVRYANVMETVMGLATGLTSGDIPELDGAAVYNASVYVSQKCRIAAKKNDDDESLNIALDAGMSLATYLNSLKT